MIGRVVSNKSKNTATVLVESTKTHPLYKKRYQSSKKYLVDDSFAVNVGDIVEFIKCRPISKRKHWRVTKVVGKDVVALGEEKMKEVAKEAISEVMPEETVKESTPVVEEKVEKKKKEIK